MSVIFDPALSPLQVSDKLRPLVSPGAVPLDHGRVPVAHPCFQ